MRFADFLDVHGEWVEVNPEYVCSVRTSGITEYENLYPRPDWVQWRIDRPEDFDEQIVQIRMLDGSVFYIPIETVGDVTDRLLGINARR